MTKAGKEVKNYLGRQAGRQVVYVDFNSIYPLKLGGLVRNPCPRLIEAWGSYGYPFL